MSGEKGQKTVHSKQMPRWIVKTQFRLFIDANLKADVEGITTLNPKRIHLVIDNSQEVLLAEELPETSTKGTLV